VLINLYSAIATMAELSLDLREVTILALMGLTAHNFLVEIAVLSSGSSNAARMTILRLLGALLVGVALGRILPESLSAELPAFGLGIGVGVDPTGSTFGGAVAGWAVSAGQLVARVALIVVLLMIGEQLLRDYGVTGWLSRRSRPLMRVFGLPDNVAFLWAVSNTLGLAYGAGVLRRELKGGEISERDGDLFCHHVALSHSLLEDTLLFVGLGVPALWLIVPRLVLAIVAVWERRLELHVRSKRCRRV
jgi:hypothetical protein